MNSLKGQPDRVLAEATNIYGYCVTNMALSALYDPAKATLAFVAKQEANPDVPFINLISQTDLSKCYFRPRMLNYAYYRARGLVQGASGFSDAQREQIAEVTSERFVEVYTRSSRSLRQHE